MATKTYHTVLNHFSFIHQPTFRLHDTAACLAFAICTVGGIRSSFDTEKDYNIMSALMKGMNPDGTTKMDGPVVPGATWESTYAKNYGGSMRGSGSWNGSQWSPTGSSSSGLAGAAERELNDEKRLVEEWDAANLVRNDKTNMLVKVSRGRSCEQIFQVCFADMCQVILASQRGFDDGLQLWSTSGSSGASF